MTLQRSPCPKSLKLVLLYTAKGTLQTCFRVWTSRWGGCPGLAGWARLIAQVLESRGGKSTRRKEKTEGQPAVAG